MSLFVTLLPLVEKAVSTIIGRIATGPASRAWNLNRLQRSLSNSIKASRLAIERRTDYELTAADMEILQEYTDSAEFRVSVERYCYSQFLRPKSRAREEVAIETEVYQRIRLCLVSSSNEHAELVAHALYEHIRDIVAVHLVETKLCDRIPQDALGPSILRSARVAASSGEKTSSFLRDQATYGPIDSLCELLAQQILRVHGKLTVPYYGSRRMVDFEDLYVEPDLEHDLGIEATALSGSELATRPSPRNCTTILGDPGGGKSTLVRGIVLRQAMSVRDGESQTIPFLVILRDFAQALHSESRSMLKHIALTCEALYQTNECIGVVEYLLLNGKALVVLDGLDELVNVALRGRVVDSIHAFLGVFPTSRVIVTSRRIGYDEAPLNADQVDVLHIRPFSRALVQDYAMKWFALEESGELSQSMQRRAEAFVRESSVVADIRSNPLMLALMCGLYSAEGYIPQNRPDLYDRCSRLLFEKWDKDRGIVHELPFSALVFPTICALAYWILGTPEREDGVSRSKMIDYVAHYLLKRKFDDFDNAFSAAEKFIDLCTGRALVLSDIGTTATEPRYGFTHRTFLEYFAARQIVRDHLDSKELFNYLIPRIARAEMEVVAQVAIQVLDAVKDGSATDILLLAIERVEMYGASRRSECSNIRSFIARACAFCEPAAEVVRKITKLSFSDLCAVGQGHGSGVALHPMYDLMCARRENLDEVSNTLLSLLPTIPGIATCEDACALGLFPTAFARRNVGGFTSIHQAFWASQAEKLRDALSKQVVDSLNSRTLRPPGWLVHFAIGRADSERILSRQGVPVPLLSAIDRAAIQDMGIGNFPQSVLHPPYLIGLLAHMANDTNTPRDEIQSMPSPRLAREISATLLGYSTPWANGHSFDNSMLPTVDKVASAGPWEDIYLETLYVTLTLFYVDYLVAKAGNLTSIKKSERREFWDTLTGGRFAHSNAFSQTLMTAQAWAFLQSWSSPTGPWLVRPS